MPLSPLLATWLVGHGHDAVHAASVGLATSSDSHIIDVARRERRTIVTADLDYPRLLATARSTEPSLILFRGGNWSEADVRTRMAMLLSSFETNEIENSILVVERERIRRRHLPLG